MTKERVLELVEKCGFEHFGEINIDALKFMDEVRQMCGANTCRSYNKNWTCPPACGTLEEVTEKAGHYSQGVLIQTTGEIEDEFDFETMMEIEDIHKKRFMQLIKIMRAEEKDFLPMASGACRLCKQCTYPDAPCRNPEYAVPSMEAYGLFVSQVCKDSGMEYYYGKNKMTYTACILIK